MKVTVKTLQQTTFSIEIEPTEKILSIKQKIADKEPKATAVEKQKLIHSGRILVDDKTAEESGIKDGDFLVLMVSSAITATKPKPVSVAPVAPATADVAAGVAASTAAPAAAPASTSTPTASTAASPTAAVVDEAAVASISEMGFPREEVIKALRASFNNADRAVEYLTNGIPDDLTLEEAEAHPTGAASAPTTTDDSTPNPLDFLRQNPQFIQLRLVVQQNPRLLGPLLEQIAQSNPEVFELIKEHQEAFMSLIQSPISDSELQALAAMDDEGGDGAAGDEEDDDDPTGADPTSIIQVTPEEQAAIERLMALGFNRPRVVEAYFACDKNETIAANFLFEHMNDEDF